MTTSRAGFPSSRTVNIAIAVLSMVALSAAILIYRNEVETRVPIEEAIERYELDHRRPTDVEALRLQPASDLRASYLSHMTLSDVYGSVALAGMSTDERGRWIRLLSTLQEQLERVRELNLDALSRRPGWAFHHAYTGELEYAALRRKSLDAAAALSPRWEVPLLNGIEAAPGNLSFDSYLGGAYLETWGGASFQREPRDVLRNAMKSSRFVTRNYRIVALILGSEEAVALLPDDPGVLRAAFALQRRFEDVRIAASLMQRIDDAERESRAQNLEAIRIRKRLGDVWGRGSAAVRWVSTHKLESLDDGQGRREVSEVLSLWPETKRGSWLGDPRSRLVQYFLSGRENAIDGAVLLDSIRLLSDVPPPIDARVRAMAGLTWEANQLLDSSGTRGSFEWTPVVVELARVYLLQDEPDKARAAIEKVPTGSRDECNVLLVRRELEKGEGEADTILRELTPDTIPAGMWSRTGALSICVDPARHKGASLVVSLSSGTSSLVSFGWDGGRIGSAIVEGPADLTIDLSGIHGRHPLGIWTEAGPKVEILGARIVSAN